MASARENGPVGAATSAVRSVDRSVAALAWAGIPVNKVTCGEKEGVECVVLNVEMRDESEVESAGEAGVSQSAIPVNAAAQSAMGQWGELVALVCNTPMLWFRTAEVREVRCEQEDQRRSLLSLRPPLGPAQSHLPRAARWSKQPRVRSRLAARAVRPRLTLHHQASW